LLSDARLGLRCRRRGAGSDGRAWQNLQRFEGRSSLRTWLYRIATNVCLDALASRSRRMRPFEERPAGTVDDPLDARPLEEWLELADGRIARWNAFLDTERLFPLFGLPAALPTGPAEAAGPAEAGRHVLDDRGVLDDRVSGFRLRVKLRRTAVALAEAVSRTEGPR